MIIQQTDEMKRLVNEFADYARMPVLNKELGDLRLLIRNVITLYSEAYKKVQFVDNIDSSLGVFLFDQEQIKRVLINLMENAIVAVSQSDSPTVKIDVIRDSTHETVCIAVSDNGTGVSDGNYTKLFEPYYSTKQGGSGLGLAIVSKIIEDHGGIIRASANSPTGVIFKIDLPYKTSTKESNNV